MVKHKAAKSETGRLVLSAMNTIGLWILNSLKSIRLISTKTQLIREIELHREIEFSFDVTISFQSFGYRHGIPLDADYIFDVRFLDNPYWDELLREKTGLDEEVIRAVQNDAKTERFLYALVGLLDNVIDGCLNMDRSTLTIAIGCTGGQHRSVVIADYLSNHYSSKIYLDY